MSGNARKTDIVDYRRERVSHYRLRGRTLREIVSLLAQEELVNPETKRPFSLGTLSADLQVLEKQWQERAQDNISAHMARLLAENAEVRRAAWDKDKLDTVLRSIKLDAYVLGLHPEGNAEQRLANATAAAQKVYTSVQEANKADQDDLVARLNEAMKGASPAQQKALLDRYSDMTAATKALADELQLALDSSRSVAVEEHGS